MWPFRHKQTLASSGILRGMTDFHSHLLPGVDDGVKTLDESLRILSLYEEQGIHALWCTPHVMEDMPNRTDRLRTIFDTLCQAYTGSIRLRLAAEYMLDSLFVERLSAGDLLPIGDEGNQLLVETSYYNPPMNLTVQLENIRKRGYHPLLAHPERYEYMTMDDYRRLKQQGVRFQLNLPSLGGVYGRRVRQKAEALLKEEMYDCMGTDMHSLRNVGRMMESKIERIEKNCGKLLKSQSEAF